MRFINYVLSFFPSKLPVGLTEFDGFVDSIIELSGQYADRNSMKWAIANMILHLGNTVSSKPKQYFVRAMRKAAANQIASAAINGIKEEQLAAQKKAADEAAKQNSADTPSQDPTNGAANPKV